MSEEIYKFEIPSRLKSIIKVVGVGGAGGNAVNFMYNQGIRDVDFVVCNTDIQDLERSVVPNKLQLGTELTEGLGAGADPDVGREAALESREQIKDMLGKDTKMVFITAGMGGGTGTGAAPVIAQIARELGILTIGIVTFPFKVEGPRKKQAADKGIAEMKNNCDSVLVILNDKWREIYGNLTMIQAYAQADTILTTAAKAIAEIVTRRGYMNVDFADVKRVMQNSGTAVMGTGQASGPDRAIEAVEQAINSPLLNNKEIKGAERALIAIISAEDFTMDEFGDIQDFISERAGPNVEVIFGHVIDPDFAEQVRVTIVATGFDKMQQQAMQQGATKTVNLDNPLPSANSNQNFGHNPALSTTTEPLKTHYESLDSQLSQPSEPAQPYYEPAPVSSNPATRPLSQAEQLEERRRRLRQMAPNSLNSPEVLKEHQVPAFKRQGRELSPLPPSSESHISRMSLNNDNEIMGNNKFLHDNVD